MARDIFDQDPDPVRLFNERIAGWGTRDEGGLPLGNVVHHALNRLTTCYAILEAVKMASDFDAIPAHYEFTTSGAAVQDQKGSREYPAAHLAPCQLNVGDPRSSGPPMRLFRIYADGVNRSHVAGLFARTEPVHRLANYADSLCERQRSGGGLAESLADNCALLAADRQAGAREVLFDKLIPAFQLVAERQITEFRTTVPEGYEPSRLVDQFGRPYDVRPADTRVHSPSPEAYRANRRAVLHILGLYAGSHNPKTDDLAKVAEQFRALRFNEKRETGARPR